MVLIAFSTIKLADLGPFPRSKLLSLGFRLPDPKDPLCKCDMNDFEAPPRLRQLSIREAMEALDSHPEQEVIEVFDS